MTEDLVVGLILFIAMAGAGIALIWMARAAAKGKLKRNRYAGIRTRKTMASEEAWRAAHVRAEKPTLLAGVVSLVGGLVALLLAGTTAIAITVAVVTGLTLILVVYGAYVGGEAADAVGGQAADATGTVR